MDLKNDSNDVRAAAALALRSLVEQNSQVRLKLARRGCLKVDLGPAAAARIAAPVRVALPDIAADPAATVRPGVVRRLHRVVLDDARRVGERGEIKGARRGRDASGRPVPERDLVGV